MGDWGHYLVAAVLAVVAGFVFGLFTAGGALTLVPILEQLLRLPTPQARGATLAIQAVTGAITAWQHARHGNLRPRPAAPMLVGTALSALVAGGVTHRLPHWLLDGLFGGMVLVAVGMLLRRRTADVAPGKPLAPWPVQLAIGFVLSFVPALVGIGGGFLFVPALYGLCGLTIHQAAGTAMLFVVATCAMGVTGRLIHAQPIPFDLVALFCVVTIASSGLGARVARALSAARLKAAFCVFLVLLGCYYLGLAAVRSRSGPTLPAAAAPSGGVR